MLDLCKRKKSKSWFVSNQSAEISIYLKLPGRSLPRYLHRGTKIWAIHHWTMVVTYYNMSKLNFIKVEITKLQISNIILRKVLLLYYFYLLLLLLRITYLQYLIIWNIYCTISYINYYHLTEVDIYTYYTNSCQLLLLVYLLLLLCTSRNMLNSASAFCESL
jgi:hypothetical protein